MQLRVVTLEANYNCRSPMVAAALILSGGHFTAQLVEEIEDEADRLDRRGSRFSTGRSEDSDSFAVGVQTEVGIVDVDPAICELAGRPEVRLVRTEGIA